MITTKSKKRRENMKNNLNWKLLLNKYKVLLLALGFTIVFPLVSGDYNVTVMNTVLLYFIAALGMSIMFGMGGSMMFCSISFMGIGGFVAAQLSKNYGVTTIVALLCAVVITGICSFLVGIPLLRLKNAFFTFATLGFLQIMTNIFRNFVPLSGGPDGISGIPKFGIGSFVLSEKKHWFVFLMIMALICGLIVERIRSSSLGRSLCSIRDNELAAQVMGVNIYRTRVIAFTIAGILAGLAGALLAFHNAYLSFSLFSYNVAVNFVIMVMLGGVNSTVGTFFGAMLVTMLPEWLRPVNQYLRLIYGISLILLMIFMPMGLAGLVESLKEKKLARKNRKLEVSGNEGQ